jgi:hypothetical protein
MSSADTSVQAAAAAPSDLPGESYVSPYALRFSVPQPVLDSGFDASPWDDPDAESDLSFAVWEAQNAHARGAAWGPPARQYPAPGLPRRDALYQRERVINIAARHIGLPYQHHHLPSWRPPALWPWLPVKAGANGLGLDCSNFSSFVFNYALGLKLPTGVGRQGRVRRLAGPGGDGCLTADILRGPLSDSLLAQLLPADLLYFQVKGKIRHVAFWVGAIGQNSDTARPVPLVIDCSQLAHRDAKGNPIPPGVQLRPFTPDSWYAAHLSHAHRLIGAAATCATPPGPAPEGDDRA